MTSPIRSLWGNLLLFLLPVLLLNGAIFGLGWDRGSPGRVHPLLPPGWVVGPVWLLLFACMAAARWLLVRRGAAREAWLVLLLAFACLLYPLYTVGLSNERIGLIGNVVSCLLAAWVAWRCLRASQQAAGLVALTAVWVAYATVALLV